MTERGVMEAAKEGATTGTFVGFGVGATRVYLDSRQFAERSKAITAAATHERPWLSASAIRSLRPSPLPALASTTAIYAGLGATYMGASAMAERARGTADLWNGVLGGLVAGSFVGLRSGSLYASAGAMAALAAASAVMDLLDNQIGPQSDDPVLEQRRAMYRE